MVDEAIDRVLYLWLVPEIAFLLGIAVVLAAGFLGMTTIAIEYPPRIRIAALAFVTVELLIPT